MQRASDKTLWAELLLLYRVRYGCQPSGSALHLYRPFCVAVDCDLKSFFDTVNHERLMSLLARRVTDKRVLQLSGGYLRVGVMLPEGQSLRLPD